MLEFDADAQKLHEKVHNNNLHNNNKFVQHATLRELYERQEEGTFDFIGLMRYWKDVKYTYLNNFSVRGEDYKRDKERLGFSVALKHNESKLVVEVVSVVDRESQLMSANNAVPKQNVCFVRMPPRLVMLTYMADHEQKFD